MNRFVIIKESFLSTLPEWVTKRKLRDFSAHLTFGEKITIEEYELNEEESARLPFEITSRIKSLRYYAHLRTEAEIVVFFKNAIFIFGQNDSEVIRKCIQYGESVGIPSAELQFREMFTNDHPDL